MTATEGSLSDEGGKPRVEDPFVSKRQFKGKPLGCKPVSGVA